MLEVIQFIKRVDPANQRNAPKAAVSCDDLDRKALPRLEFTMEASDRDLLVALEAKRLPGCSFLEAERQDTHADQI